MIRHLQDTISMAAPSASVVEAVTRQLAVVVAQIEPTTGDELSRLSGNIDELPGRGQILIPAYTISECDRNRINGRVTFGDHYLGGNGAVHGGAIPLLFDDIMGVLANSGQRIVARTAYLHVEYRNVAPVGLTLDFEAWFAEEEGRKRLLNATLRDGDSVCAEAEGLFIELREGQA